MGVGVVQSSSSYGCHDDEMQVASNQMIPLLDRSWKGNMSNYISTFVNNFEQLCSCEQENWWALGISLSNKPRRRVRVSLEHTNTMVVLAERFTSSM